ncbi:TetR/AcrR family transcriptional regulator [uncultured Roseibium sp.]|uniref:TetR/AcrR family transcriptional regulator n=1 Tax=uncultured Roseibium sp. TaxID=1936171 RepID=UPI00321718BF
MNKTNAAQKTDQKPKAAVSRQEILLVAARMMRERGYAETSLRDLAAEVGMKAGSLYYHFASKEVLATEVMRLGVEIVSDAVTDGLKRAGDLSPREQLVNALQIHLETLLSASDFSSAHIRCYPFVPDTVQAELKGARRDYDRVWNGIIRAYLGEEAEDRQVRYLRYALVGALNWSLEWFDPKRDSVSDYIVSVARLLPDIDPS